MKFPHNGVIGLTIWNRCYKEVHSELRSKRRPTDLLEAENLLTIQVEAKTEEAAYAGVDVAIRAWTKSPQE